MLSFLRRIKATYWFNNLIHKNTLDCNTELYKKYGLQQSVLNHINNKQLKNLPAIDTPWLDNNTITAQDVANKNGFATLNAAAQNAVVHWSKNGYAIMPQLFTTQECNTINTAVEKLLADNKATKRFDERIIFAIHKSDAVYNISTKPQVMELLSFILGKKVKLFQSLNFRHGSSQRAHSDTIHMTTHPLGYMIAVWIALEDIHADAGPLFYYPGSHQLPYVLNEDYNHGGNYFMLGHNAYQKYEDAIQQVIENNKLEKQIFLAKKGDAFIWHANILHGGEPIVNPALTRKSMVLHFYAEDVICYHEITERPAIFGGKEAHCP